MIITDPNAIKFGDSHEGEEFRKTISAVVHRKKDKKFLMVKWKKFGWIAPVIGGIEEGEDVFKSAEREVLEETGYKVKSIKKLGGEVESHFFAENKNTWRHRVDQAILMELIDETPIEISTEEKNQQEPIWMGAEEAIKSITHNYNSIGLLRYLGRNN